jgi:tetratricopeptide (TPR) repeat protein
MSLLRTTLLLLFSCILLASCKPREKTSAHSTVPKSADLVDENRRFMDACKEKIKGNLELAVTGFNDVLRIDPSNAAAHYELAGLYHAQGRTEQALTHAKAAAFGDPSNEWYLWLYAQVLQDNHNNAEAAVQFQKLIHLSPIKLEYYYGYSDALLYQGKYKEALKVYDEIEQKLGESEEVTLQKAKVFERTGEFDKSVAELRKLINQNPQETKYYALLGQLFQDRMASYKSKGNTEKFNETNEKRYGVFTDLLKKDPGNPLALLSISEYYLSKAKYDSAFITYKIALANPDLDIDSKVKVAQNYYYESEKDPKVKAECEELCRIITETHPHEVGGHAIFGDFLYREKRLPEARTEYRKAVDADKSKYVLWNQLLIIDSEMNDYQHMLADSKDATELFPSQPIPYFFNGIANIQARKYAEAIEVLTNGIVYVLDNKPLESQFDSNLGDAYYKIKEYQKSDEAYDKALAIDPDNAYVLNNYSYYLSLRNAFLEKAEKMSKRSNELEPGNANFRDTYAWILYRLGKYDQAKEWMDKILSTTTEPGAVMLEHYGDILYHLGQPDDAVKYWQKAKTKGGGSELLDKKVNEKKLYE